MVSGGTDMDEIKPNDSNKVSKSGYKKGPWWFWVLVYLVVAGIVYAVIYFLFIHKAASGGGGYSY
jgi:hypothetical protein